jgi:hypothetical protein
MRRRGTISSVVSGAIASALLLGGVPAVQAVQWSFAPNARLASDYVDNPRFLSEGGGSSLGMVAELGAEVGRRTEQLDVRLQPLLRFSRYRDDESLNSEDQIVDLVLQHRSERGLWSLDSTLIRNSTLVSELGTTGRTQVNRRHQIVTVGGGPTLQFTERLVAAVQVSLIDNSYEDAGQSGLVDYRYSALSIIGAYSLSPRTELSLDARAGQLDVPSQGTTTRDGTLVLALKHALGTLWKTTLTVGPARVESDFGSDDGLVFGAKLDRVGELLTLSADAGRTLMPTGRGVQTRRDQIGVGALWNVTERISAAVSVHASRQQDLLPTPGVAFEEIEYQWVEARIARQLSAEWSAALAVSGAEQHNLAAPDSAQGYHVYLGLVWKGQPRMRSR